MPPIKRKILLIIKTTVVVFCLLMLFVFIPLLKYRLF